MLCSFGVSSHFTGSANGRDKENRRIAAINNGKGEIFVSWRLLKGDHIDTTFNLYRSTDEKPAIKVNGKNRITSTNFIDTTADKTKTNTYFVRPIFKGREIESNGYYTLTPSAAMFQNYISIPLQTNVSQGAKHVGTGDLDGDGDYDFVVKRGNQDIDPSQSTVPTETYKLEGYTNTGQFLWRVDLGVNIRPGVWYSPFVVYDLDGDGRAEIATKIGESAGNDWNGDGITNYTDAQGRALTGPEYFVIIDGLTGQIRARTDWIERGTVSSWGDNYGNRVDRHLMGVGYVNGERPSLLIFRGTYTKMYAEAWDFYSSNSLTRRWRWYRDSGGGGFHNIRVGDIDNDGRDEIINGSIAIDDNGSQLWITGEGHGDRMHMSDIDPNRPGKEIWYVQEGGYTHPVHLRQASNGSLIWSKGDTSWADVGRGTAMDIHPNYAGLECWSSGPSILYSATGVDIGARPSSINFGIWWDGDLLRELLDGNVIDKWNVGNTTTRLNTASGVTVGSRNAPLGYGDVMGDWREEVWYTVGNTELRIYTTSISTSYSFPSFTDDRDYRTSMACETMGYMQSTQPGFYFGVGMSTPLPSPWITTDVGPVGVTGSAVYSNGAFTLNGSGTDIWGTSDEFRYVYQSASGDCSITARVASVENTNSWAKAGVMIRDSLNSNAMHAMVVATPVTSTGVAFQYRMSTGGTSVNLNTTGIAAPHWVRVVRSGNTFTAYRSPDGNSWTTIGSTTIPMGTNVSIGLVTTSHADGIICTSSLTNVAVTP